MSAAFDIAIVGAGMAGASLAAAIGSRARVLLIESEAHAGYHATGRSAAFWTESYGGPQVQPLTVASGPVLRDLGVLTSRGALTMGRVGQEHEVEAFAAQYRSIGVEVQLLDRDAMVGYVPGLRPEWICAALEPSTCDIDVGALHQHYLAQAQREGAELWCRAGLRSAERVGSGWVLNLANGRRVDAAILVNASGAWADPVAQLAGINPLSIIPYRRTIAQIGVGRIVPDTLPLVLDVAGRFYFKPESGRLWLSPHDETPSAPCDAAAEELDVALAIDRFEHVVDWPVTRVEHRWAGLRSFAPDRLPVYGFDTRDKAFFWFAGQGGFGIQTAPAAAELASRLLLGEGAGALDPAPYAPNRFGAS